MTVAYVVMWMLLANGSIEREYFRGERALDNCLRTQSILQLDQEIRGERRFARILCIEAFR